MTTSRKGEKYVENDRVADWNSISLLLHLSSSSHHLSFVVATIQVWDRTISFTDTYFFYLDVVFLEYIECLLHVSHFQFDAQVCRLDGLNSSHYDFEVRQDTNVSIEIQSMLLREMDINELILL